MSSITARAELSRIDDAIVGTSNYIEQRGIPFDVTEKILALMRLSFERGKLIKTIEIEHNERIKDDEDETD